jgi:predicted GTPase
LLELLIKHREKPYALNALVSYTRQGLDYEFFTLMTSRIETAPNAEKEGLTALRDKLMALVQQIDKQMKQQVDQARLLLNEILRSPNVEKATEEHFQEIDEFFTEVLRAELAEARKKGDYERSGRIQAIIEVIQKASAPPPEYEFIEQLISVDSEVERQQALENNADKLTPEFLQMLSGLASQMEGEGQAEVGQRLQEIYNQALRYSMKRKMMQ